MKDIKEYEERFEKIVSNLCSKYGLYGSGVFCDFKDFKYQWSLYKDERYLEVRASDYVIDAPDDVLYNLTESVMTKQILYRNNYTDKLVPYSAETIKWLTSGLGKEKQDLYISRGKLEYNERLDERIQYLKDKGLITVDDIVAVHRSNVHDIVRYSILFGIICVDDDMLVLSDPELDFILYSTQEFIRVMRINFDSPSVNGVVLESIANNCKEEFSKLKYEDQFKVIDLDGIIRRFMQ